MNQKKPDIKIFVSHRIDQESETIDNPLFVNVRCGAVYDKRENITMMGDDTGDNISEKRESFCELTVQYWAWKNVEADYYGLCHYRRYLSFSEKELETDFRNQIIEPNFNYKVLNAHTLTDNIKMQSIIQDYDIIVNEYSDIRKIPTPLGNKKNIKEHWKGWDNLLIRKDTINKLLSLIKQYYPEILDDANKYLLGYRYRGYNCYILRKEIFHAMCEFQFDILFKMENELDTVLYSKKMNRTLGFMGELLCGIFIYHLEQKEKYKLKNLKLMFFENTKKQKEPFPAYQQNNIPIVLLSSSYYVPYLGVFLKSLAKEISPTYNYDVIILHKELSELHEEKLKSIVGKYPNISLRFYNPKSRIGDINFHVASPVYSEEAYYRLLTPWILNHYERAIVMDCDIIVKTDLANLYTIDLEGNLVAGVKDIVYQGMLNGVVEDALEYGIKVMGMDNPYNYINTGVLVMDLKSIRNKYTEASFIKMSQKKKFRIQEQDVLNIIMENQVKFIDIRWNYYVEMNNWVSQCIESAPASMEDKYREVEKSKEGPYLIHYANIPKPWDNPGIVLADEFWTIAKETIFYEELLARMIDVRTQDIRVATYDIQCRMGIFDHRSGIRKLADKLLPLNSNRRKLAKIILPKGSCRWKFCKQVYYILRPQYRPSKEIVSQDSDEDTVNTSKSLLND